MEKFTYFPKSGSCLFHPSNRIHGQKSTHPVKIQFFCPRIVAVSPIILPPFEKNSITNTHTHNHTFIQTPFVEMENRVKKFLVMLVEPEAVVSKWFSSFKTSFFINPPPPSPPQVDPEILFSCAYLIFPLMMTL